jgi:hypothetical protein
MSIVCVLHIPSAILTSSFLFPFYIIRINYHGPGVSMAILETLLRVPTESKSGYVSFLPLRILILIYTSCP